MADEVAQLKYLTFSKCKVPLVGALFDYMDTSFQYMRQKTYARAEKLHQRNSKSTLSASFMALTCFLLGLVCNVKFEVVTLNEEPLHNDLHFMLLSKDDQLYIDDINTSNYKRRQGEADWFLELCNSLEQFQSFIALPRNIYREAALEESGAD